MNTTNPHLPGFLHAPAGGGAKAPVWFLRPRGRGFDPDDERVQAAFNGALVEVLSGIPDLVLRPPVLVKVHIGEPRCRTAMRPAYTTSSLEFARARGIDQLVFGDTTVCYSGPRGYHENGPEAGPYLALARERGWCEAAPFVVLDRPRTSVPDRLSFEREGVVQERDVSGLFRRFSLAGGFAAAGSVLNHVHLTLHKLAGVALCVKGLTMGLSGREGKLAMHQCFLPEVDAEICQGCGACRECCPENALAEDAQGRPLLDDGACIGCGECLEACPEEAIRMAGREVLDWTKGAGSLAVRMTDYLMGLVDGRWSDVVHIAHLYDITSNCDCLDEAQAPICDPMGFLVGRNPLAVDRASRRLLADVLWPGASSMEQNDNTAGMFAHAEDKYGLITEPELIPVEIGVVR